MRTRGPFPEEMRTRFGVSDNGGQVEAETQQNRGHCQRPLGFPRWSNPSQASCVTWPNLFPPAHTNEKRPLWFTPQPLLQPKLAQEEGGWRKGKGPATPHAGHPGLGYRGQNPSAKRRVEVSIFNSSVPRDIPPSCLWKHATPPQRSALGAAGSPHPLHALTSVSRRLCMLVSATSLDSSNFSMACRSSSSGIFPCRFFL